MTSPLLSVKNLSYSTPEGKVLAKGINFDLFAGDILTIKGPNGTGKTTLLNVLLGHHQKFSGEIKFYFPKKDIAYLPQLQNVVFHFPITLKEILQISSNHVFDLQKIFNLGLIENQHLDLSWNTASGGERKRTLITRELLKNANLFIFDEPLNHLDHMTKQKVSSALSNFIGQNQSKKAIVMVSHEMVYEKNASTANINFKELNLGDYQ